MAERLRFAGSCRQRYGAGLREQQPVAGGRDHDASCILYVSDNDAGFVMKPHDYMIQVAE